MGWDAFATPFNGLTGPEHDAPDPDFVVTARTVLEAEGCVDGLLEHGGLDVSTCGYALEQATRNNVFVNEPWSAADVQRLAPLARWDFELDQPWAKASARAFLNRCAELGRGIRFSF